MPIQFILEDNHIHIVSFDIPYPPDYGGVIDVFFKIKALSDLGVKIHLHCFQYGRKKSTILEGLCHEVFYYPRKRIYTGIVSRVPYIVGSRINPDLLERLSLDAYPILFEGLHTCAYLDHPLLAEKTKGVRMHNVEWQYYRGLFDYSTDAFKSIYYAVESKRLHRFESVLIHANHIFGISKTETEYLINRYPQTTLLFPFHGVNINLEQSGTGKFALYHGNLSVPENEEAVYWLLENLKSDVKFPIIIAGKKPNPKLKTAIEAKLGFELVENPSDQKMDDLITNAQLHILPTFQSTGVKLKLIKSLFRGRFVLVNPEMVEGTGLEELCYIFKNPDSLNRLVKELKSKVYEKSENEKRGSFLSTYDDRKAARTIIAKLFT